ncbi:MAG: hypothetical protein AAFX54_10420 [Pseudomonadota bacterium]
MHGFSRYIYSLYYTWPALLVSLVLFLASSGQFLDAAGLESETLSNVLLWAARLSLLPVGARFGVGYQRYGKVDFEKVFGKKISTSEYAISVPEFTLSADANDALNDAGMNNSRRRFSPIGVDSNYKAGDINKIIASSDIIGAAYVADSLGRYTDEGPKFRFGTNHFLEPVGFLAFGLQTNLHAPQFIDLVSGAKKKKIIFRYRQLTERHPNVAHKIVAMKKFEDLTLAPVHDGRSADLIFSADGDTIRVSQDHQHDWNIGLVIIARGQTRNELDLRWITCAGVGHGGTSGSSYFLAHHWQRFAKDFTKSCDAIVSITLTEMIAEGDGADYQDQKKANDSGTIELARISLRGL